MRDDEIEGGQTYILVGQLLRVYIKQKPMKWDLDWSPPWLISEEDTKYRSYH